MDFDALIERLIEDATERFLSPSLPPSEWDYEGLGRWAAGLGLSLPIRQWAADEPAEEEAPDYERRRREEIRRRIRQRAESRLRQTSPADAVAKVVEPHAERLLAAPEEEGTEGYRPLAQWLGRALEVPVGEADLRQAVGAELDAIEADLVRRALGARATPERAYGGLFDAFLRKDLADPDRDLTRAAAYVQRKYGLAVSPFDLSKLTVEEMGERLMERTRAAYRAREEAIGPDKMRLIEKILILEKTDAKWKDHLLAMDHLKAGIGLRGYAQLDPKVEYTREARRMFDEMLASLREEVTDLILKLDIGAEEAGPVSVYAGATEQPAEMAEAFSMQEQQEQAIAATEGREKPKPIRAGRRVRRNAPCPCGSGKKYKNCCGKAA